MAAPWTVRVRPFGSTRPDVLLYTLTNGKLSATVSNFGATITQLFTPDISGESLNFCYLWERMCNDGFYSYTSQFLLVLAPLTVQPGKK